MSPVLVHKKTVIAYGFKKTPNSKNLLTKKYESYTFMSLVFS